MTQQKAHLWTFVHIDHGIPLSRGQPKRLLIAGMGNLGGGLSKVISCLAEHLSSEWEILHFAHSIEGNCFKPIDHTVSFSCQTQEWEPATLNTLKTCLNQFNPDVVLVSAQPWKSPEFVDVIKAHKASRLALYMPVEGEPIIDDIYPSLRGIDLCITYTDLVAKAFSHQNTTPEFISIGHGIDAAFSTRGKGLVTADRQARRQALFPMAASFWKRPMVLNSNRCYARKRLDLSIKGFSKALETHDASLYLHINGLSDYEHSKLKTLVTDLSLEKNVMINALNPRGDSIPKSTLRRLMMACDVGLTTSMGEGWGLGSFEHASAGAAQIVPAHTTFSELWPNDTAVTFPAYKKTQCNYEQTYMYEGKPNDIGQAISALVGDTETLRFYQASAKAHTKHQKFQWPHIGEKFSAALEGLIDGEKTILSNTAMTVM